MNKISIVYQTHWDREWYLNVDTYNIRLKKVMKQIVSLLDRDVIDSFVLDGQVKALEDYFSVCEDFEKTRVLSYLKEGRIIIGPWYILSDEFLVTGESIIRNMEMGMEISKKYADYQNIGYLPDTFGHISQMPQILNQFGIEDAILWRGVLPEDTFFNWEGAENSNLFVVFLKEGYYQPIVDQANYQQLMKTYIEKYESFTDYDHILLTNGGDHLSPSFGDISKNIETLKKEFNIEIESTSYEKYINHVEDKTKYQTIKGELRDNQNCYVLPNVYSTRYYLKQQNQETENNIRSLEAMIAKNYINRPYDYSKMMDNIWKTFILNHPHDSICGCSIDDVHDEMEIRTMKLNHQINNLIKNEFINMDAYPDRLHYTDSETKIFDDYRHFSVYNPTVRTINSFKKIKILVNKESDLVDNFIVTSGNTDYTTYIISKKETRLFEVPLDYFPEFRGCYEYEIVFRVKDLKGLTSNTYTLKTGTPIFLQEEDTSIIENDYLEVKATEDGSLSIFDKKQNKVFTGINKLVSSLDAGDEYNYSKPQDDVLSEAKLEKVTALKGEHYQQLNMEISLQLPEGLNKTRDGGSDKMVTNYFKVKASIFGDSEAIEFNVEYENNAKNHRTRALFDTNGQMENHYSDTAFDIIERKIREEEFTAEKYKEVPVVVDPSLSMISTDQGIRIDHIGIHEYQVTRNETDLIELTLMRSVGDLSRDDFESRGGGAGPSFETPGAQMIGNFSYCYTISMNSEVFDTNETYKQPLIVSKGYVKDSGSLLTIDNKKVHLSSLRKKNDAIEVRVFNPTNEKQPLAFKSIHNFNIKTVDLLGNDTKKQGKPLASKEIRTYLLTVKSDDIKEVDVVVAGGSVGGVLSAKKLAEKGLNVLLTEETDWLGGQLTSQAVPLDEHPFIESFGSTKSYREFRDSVREYYKSKDLKEPFKSEKNLNPGGAWVSRLSFEPKVALKMFNDMLTPYIGKNLEVIYNVKPVSSDKKNAKINNVTFEDLSTLNRFTVKAKMFIDATEIGDLLPVTNTEFVTGAEGKEVTHELHAGITDKQDMQPVTHVIALEWDESNTELIDKPDNYEYYRSLKTPYDDQFVLSEYGPDSSTGKARKFNIVDGRMPLWSYRQFLDPNKFVDLDDNKKTTINWPQNDYFLGNIFDDEFEDFHKEEAKKLTQAFVYYLQNDIPRHDGGFGYTEMKVNKDSLGTLDGFAKYPYIREGRRIKALSTIIEDDISGKTNETLPHVKHSIGVGCYHIDLHITTKSNEFFFDNTWPFEIPLEAFIPIETENLIPACKNIGTTHLTNGSFRLHPVEWNIGESAGLLAYFVLEKGISTKELSNDETLVKEFQSLLVQEGIELEWPENKVKVI